MRATAAACALLFVSLALPSGAVSAASVRCTISGTAGNDRLVGTAGKDVICGRGGDDVLVGRGGADILDGAGGRDVLKGGAGADVLTGSRGDDLLSGGAGADQLEGGAGTDTVTYAGTSAAVTADFDRAADDGAKNEKDRITSTENLVGGSGDDTLTGDGKANMLTGGPGADSLTGEGGTDTLIGTRGDDSLSGGPEADSLSGGAANDTLIGGTGTDRIDGGTGINYCDASADEPAATSCRYDTTNPEVVSVSTNQASYRPGDRLDISIHVRDGSGVNYTQYVVTLGGQQYGICEGTMRLVSGTARDGVWGIGCTVPSTVRNGTYEVSPYARDVMGNWTNMNSQNLIPLRATFAVLP